MDIAITGNFNTDTIKNKSYTLHKVLLPGSKLYIGNKCNDGRPITESWRYKQAIKQGIPIVRKTPTVGTASVSANQDKNNNNNKEMLVDKYIPKSVSDIIGHKEQINQITSWLQSWENGLPVSRGVLVTGPPGIGKTTTVHLIAETLGYKVTEYNASDSRSVSVLRGLIALGIKRLVKEIIVMDEIDGLSERGGVGELADIIRKTRTPIICIANEKPPKLRPIINACIDIKFNRPNKSTIATAMLKVAKSEGIDISKANLEEMCENGGNDIRSILNSLEFYGSDAQGSEKDNMLRLDIFSATQKLIGNKHRRLDESANLVFVDYNMIPLMVQEAYLASSRGGLEEAVLAADYLSVGDIMNRKIHQRQEWSLLPHYVGAVVAAARTVSGPPPFQIFPQWLGKNSKRLKHSRYLDNLSSKMCCTNEIMRRDYAEPLNRILMSGLTGDKPDIKGVIRQMDAMRLTRDDIMEQLQEVLFETVEIPTKTKTALTREYNKTHSGNATSKTIKKRKIDLNNDDDGSDDGSDDGNNGDRVDGSEGAEDIEMMLI